MEYLETTRRYSRAPLTEALLDLRVRLPDDVVATDLAAAQESEKERYPYREGVRQIQSRLIGRGEGVGSTSASQILTGYRTSTDSTFRSAPS